MQCGSAAGRNRFNRGSNRECARTAAVSSTRAPTLLGGYPATALLMGRRSHCCDWWRARRSRIAHADRTGRKGTAGTTYLFLAANSFRRYRATAAKAFGGSGLAGAVVISSHTSRGSRGCLAAISASARRSCALRPGFEARISASALRSLVPRRVDSSCELTMSASAWLNLIVTFFVILKLTSEVDQSTSAFSSWAVLPDRRAFSQRRQRSAVAAGGRCQNRSFVNSGP